MKDLQKKTAQLSNQETKNVVAQVTRVRAFNCPLPPPEYLQEYEKIVPGTTERILTMAEKQCDIAVKQSDHRIKTEKDIVNNTLKQKWVGLVVGIIVLFIILAMGFFLAIKGFTVLAGIILTTTLLGVLAIMVLGKNPFKNKE